MILSPGDNFLEENCEHCASPLSSSLIHYQEQELSICEEIRAPLDPAAKTQKN
jgi:hypothetical protein